MEIATNRDEMRICDQQNSQNKKGGLVGSVLKLRVETRTFQLLIRFKLSSIVDFHRYINILIQFNLVFCPYLYLILKEK